MNFVGTTTYEGTKKDADELILKGSLLFFEKSYPLGVIAILGNFFLNLRDTLFI